jgi:hypothetical protein
MALTAGLWAIYMIHNTRYTYYSVHRYNAVFSGTRLLMFQSEKPVTSIFRAEFSSYLRMEVTGSSDG